MDWILGNIPFLCVVLVLILKVISGIKRGIIKEICSLVSFFMSSIIILLLAVLVRGYFNNDRILFVLTIILLVLMIVVYKILDLALTTLKFIGKLTNKSIISKLLGAVFGVAETVLIVWAIYCLTIVFNGGAIEKAIIDCAKSNPVMRIMYEYNYLYSLLSSLGAQIGSINLWEKLGM